MPSRAPAHRRPSTVRTTAIVTFGGVAALIAMPLAAAASAVGSAGSTTAMEMRNYQFAMPALQVAVGDSVTWTNADKALHDATTTKAPVAFGSPLLKTGESWTYTFTAPGTYDYNCSVHPKMIASIVATGEATHSETHEAPAPAKKKDTLAKAAKPAKTTAVEPAAKSDAAAAEVKAAEVKAADAKAAKAEAAQAAAKKAEAATAKAATKVKVAPKSVPSAIVAKAAPEPVVAAPASAPVAAAASSDKLDLGTTVLGGGLGVATVVLALMLYGVRAGRRT